MAEPDKRPVTMEELLVSSLAQTDALAKLLIEKGLITREEDMEKISEERATYQKLFNPTQQYPYTFWGQPKDATSRTNLAIQFF